jgi:transcriptional regulator with XRE-family HTH domain
MAGTAFQKAFAREIRRARTALELSQEQLADHAGLHRNYVGMIERCERSPTLVAAEGIAHALKLRLSELIARAESRGN